MNSNPKFTMSFKNISAPRFKGMINPKKKFWRTSLIILISLIASNLLSCSPAALFTGKDPDSQSTPPTLEITYATPIPEAEITFQVVIPPNTPPDESISINILEEVTGLALNTLTYPMDAIDSQNYGTTLRFTVGSVIKYRYSRHGSTATLQEHTTDGRPTRYRMLHIQGPGSVQDVVSRWTDTGYSGTTGRISGQALDSITGQPIPNLLITAGGAQALTTSDGSYLIEGLPPGTHNLVAYSLDGAHQVFQQGALVATDSTTPAELRLQPAEFVNVTFDLTVPEGTIPAVPIRIAGNLSQLGNTFADLAGGMSVVAPRMPILNLLSANQYNLTLQLPVGADIHYTYTLGDGFWNTELTETGGLRLRQFIVPDSDVVLRDAIDAWLSEDTKPITFDITVPANTPPEDIVSLQLNPIYGWTEPLPMWNLGNNRWAYVLNGPPQILNSISYRYCRNNQCGSADDANTAGPAHAGYAINTDSTNQTPVNQVSSWIWQGDEAASAPVEDSQNYPRNPGFITGVALQPSFHPNWVPLTPNALNDIQGLGANWVIYTPTWTYTRTSPPVLEPVTGRDPLWGDMLEMVGQTITRGVNAAIYPTPAFPDDADTWWVDAPRDYSWWVVWFDRYRNFLLHHADLAYRSGGQALILGGNWVTPALPGGTLADGSPSGIPADAEDYWRNLIQEIRMRYNGSIGWAISEEQIVNNPPPFLDAVDLIYIEFSPRLADNGDPTVEAMTFEAGRILDETVLPLQTQTGKPVVLAISAASADGAAMGCLTLPDSEQCLDPAMLSRPNADIPEIAIDLAEQADIYSAILRAVNERPWISGVIASGYYPPTKLADKSMSVHGKPVEETLRYWFPAWSSPPQ